MVAHRIEADSDAEAHDPSICEDSAPDRARVTQRRLSPREVEDLVARRWGGETIEDLSIAFGIHRTTVMAQLRRAGVPGRPRSKRWSQRTLQREASRYEAGDSLADIAARYGISPSTVGRRLLDAGLQLRPRPGR